MAKTLEQLKPRWVFPIPMPKTYPCGCCKSRINPEREAFVVRYDNYYCDRICLVAALGGEFVGDGLDVVFEDVVYPMDKFMKEMECRQYG